MSVIETLGRRLSSLIVCMAFLRQIYVEGSAQESDVWTYACAFCLHRTSFELNIVSTPLVSIQATIVGDTRLLNTVQLILFVCATCLNFHICDTCFHLQAHGRNKLAFASWRRDQCSDLPRSFRRHRLWLELCHFRWWGIRWQVFIKYIGPLSMAWRCSSKKGCVSRRCRGLQQETENSLFRSNPSTLLQCTTKMTPAADPTTTEEGHFFLFIFSVGKDPLLRSLTHFA